MEASSPIPVETDPVPTLAREIVCPDGTQYIVHADGAWVHETWGGQFIRDHSGSSTTQQEVIAKLGL